MKCSHCHATFLKSEALELESTPTLVSYGGAKTYACPFCKSQYHFEREPAVSEAAGPSSLALSNSPAFKGMEQVQADAHQGSEPSEVNPTIACLSSDTVHMHMYVYVYVDTLPTFSIVQYVSCHNDE